MDDKELISKLEGIIKEAEEIDESWITLEMALSNARGTLSAIMHPPKGYGMISGDLANAGGDHKVTRVIFDLQMAIADRRFFRR